MVQLGDGEAWDVALRESNFLGYVVRNDLVPMAVDENGDLTEVKAWRRQQFAGGWEPLDKPAPILLELDEGQLYIHIGEYKDFTGRECRSLAQIRGKRVEFLRLRSQDKSWEVDVPIKQAEEGAGRSDKERIEVRLRISTVFEQATAEVRHGDTRQGQTDT